MVKNEKEMLCTVDGIDWEIFMASCYLPSKLESRIPKDIGGGNLTSAGPQPDSKFSDGRELIERRRDHVCAKCWPAWWLAALAAS